GDPAALFERYAQESAGRRSGGAGLGLAIVRWVAEAHGGVFPQTEEALLDLPGIGAYTAAAIAAIAFDEPAVVVDGNIERVMSRLFLIETPLPKSKPEIKAAAATIWPDRRSGDFAQALMDLGAGICKPKNPQCEACPLMGDCAARKAGVAETLPKKKKRAEKPVRLGAAFVLFNADGSVLLERRPDKGLLGGMLGFPGTDWTEAGPSDPAASAPEKRRWRTIGEARHTFTHFHLRLAVMSATATRAPKPDEIWMSPADARLPTVMKKALDLAIDAQGRLL
ncbi:MAG: NUDIX domain-containing protein, partial [Pseudomonadota bacterium]